MKEGCSVEVQAQLREVAALFARPDEFLSALKALSHERKVELLEQLATCARERNAEGAIKLMFSMLQPEPTPSAPLTEGELQAFAIHNCQSGRCATCALLSEVRRLRKQVDLKSWGGDNVLAYARETIARSRAERGGVFASDAVVFARAVVRLATGRDWDQTGDR
jgi:hypothetical protein